MKSDKIKLLAISNPKRIFKKKEHFFRFVKCAGRMRVYRSYLNRFSNLMCDSNVLNTNNTHLVTKNCNYTKNINNFYKNSKALCSETSRGKGVYPKFCLSRIVLKNLIERGDIVGYAPVS